MVKRNVIVRNMNALESLGAVTNSKPDVLPVSQGVDVSFSLLGQDRHNYARSVERISWKDI